MNELSEWVCLFILPTYVCDCVCVRVPICVYVCQYVCTCGNMCAHLRERTSALSQSVCTSVTLYARGCGHVWVWMRLSIAIHLSLSIPMSVCLAVYLLACVS